MGRNVLRPEKREKLQPERVAHAVKKIKEKGLEVIDTTDTTVVFIYKGKTIRHHAFTGWHSGKGITDGRGLDHLLKQLV